MLRLSEVTKRIDSALSESGISKKEFYEACDITSSAYSQWNTGKTEPRPSKLREISNYLNVRYEWLAYGIGKKEKAPTPEGERPKSKWRSIARLEDSQITPEQDEQIADYIDFLLSKKKDL